MGIAKQPAEWSSVHQGPDPLWPEVEPGILQMLYYQGALLCALLQSHSSVFEDGPPDQLWPVDITKLLVGEFQFPADISLIPPTLLLN